MGTSESEMSNALFVKCWFLAFGFCAVIFIISALAVWEFPNIHDVPFDLLSQSLTARMIVGVSGVILGVLCIWGIEYQRDKRKQNQ